MPLLDIILRKESAAVHRSKIIGNFFFKKKNRLKYRPDQNPIENLWAILMQSLRNQKVFFLRKFRKKVLLEKIKKKKFKRN